MHFKRRQAHTVRTWRTTLQGVDGSRIARWASIIPHSKPPEIAIGSQAALIIEQLSVLPPVNCNGHITLLPYLSPNSSSLCHRVAFSAIPPITELASMHFTPEPNTTHFS